MSTLESIRKLQTRMGESIIGQQSVIEQLIIGLLANGNILMEGLPGLAKTRAVKSLAKNLDADFSRIQFTPDLLPSDITGSEVLYTEAGQPTFRFQAGPIFANIVLADEINRAPAKVQAALLEAMEERQVTVGGETRELPKLFMVLATQNPIDQEGTYPLPEAQMDRFILHVKIGYPSEESETAILRLVREEAAGSHKNSREAIDQSVIFDARTEIHNVHVSDAIEKYIVDLITATRYPERYEERLGPLLDFGASPRGTISLDKASRAFAWLQGRDFVGPDDVRSIAHEVLRHRIGLSYEAEAEGVSADDIIDDLLKLVAVA
jgi:MoxR-like ATPase